MRKELVAIVMMLCVVGLIAGCATMGTDDVVYLEEDAYSDVEPDTMMTIYSDSKEQMDAWAPGWRTAKVGSLWAWELTEVLEDEAGDTELQFQLKKLGTE